MGRIYGFAEKFEHAVDAASAPLPSQGIKLWLAGFFRPEETYEKVEKTATLAGLAGNLLIFYFAYSLIFFLFMLVLTSSLSEGDLLSMGLQKSPDLAQAALGSLVIGPIASALSALFAFALVFISARVLGGDGTYAKQANSMSLVLCGSNILLLAFMCVAFAIFIPSFLLRDSAFVGSIVSIATLLASLPLFLMCLAILVYTIYAYYLVARKAHNISSWRAAGAIVIAAALVVLLDIALNAVLA
ncbi:MAG: YIP1 family protein [Candidatus Micrarchaeota archaeon]|nr:YIP1 family protein [Candidatus Micrarchaeota archaeon]